MSGRAAGTWLAGLLAIPIAASGAVPAEHWFEVQLDGVGAGYEHELTRDADGEGTETRHESSLVVQRLDTRLEMREEDDIREDGAGHLMRMRATLRESDEPTLLEVVVRPDALIVTTEAGGRRYERRLPAEPDLLGPAGVRARTRAWLAAPAQPLAFAQFDAELGDVTRSVRRWIGRDADGHAIVEETTPGMPETNRIVLDGEGTSLEESQPSPFGRISIRLATEAAARAAAEGGIPAEVFARNLLRSHVRLPDPRRLARLRVEIRGELGNSAWPDLAGPGQRVVERGPGHRILELTRVEPGPDRAPDALPGDPDLRPNALLQSDDPDVLALARSLRRPGAGVLAQSFAIRDWVATHLRFDLGLAVAPAGEIVRHRRGTCVEYAVLTATLARALGIPSRIALGYAYIEGVFGGHAWTEVRLGSRWVPIDAALWSPGVADAARIALAHHGGELGNSSGTLELARLLGRITIRVQAFALGSRTVAVPADALPFRITGPRYENPWLGLSIEAPPGWRYEALDEVYPNSTLLRMTAADGHWLALAAADTPASGHSPHATADACDESGRRCTRRVGATDWTLEASDDTTATLLPGVWQSLRIRE